MSATIAPTVAAPPGRRRRVGIWVAIGMAVLVVGAIGAALTAGSEWVERDALDPDSAGPTGTRALARILEDHGVEVRIARDHEEVAALLSGDADTLVLPDTPSLSDERLRELVDLATDVVLIEPRARTIDLLIPSAAMAGAAAPGVVSPACALGDAERSGGIEPGALFTAAGGVSACYPVDGAHGLLMALNGDRRSSVVDGTVLFTNAHLADNGNAALGLNLMGRHPLVVWYQPGLADTDLADTDFTLGELTPPWVSPVIVLFLIAGVAAGIWRGRRFGPLVAERLPVTVRASETTEGRARLYAQSRDALHAADQLRIGTLERLSHLLGLGAGATAQEIADAAAARAGLDRGAARGILLDDVPATDADLVDLSQRLRQLEDAVHARVRPERNPR
ncbi:DUF4350 domain-containing protein [Microbacterium sp. SSM24]|uniref:DUF4350 domain-containing protein n=1 Tax=Microbacterium sp. SSM24 TaxID=2991714 RepID=UPI002226CFD0|nr:DUF4350 domain-containing protein [Microbacterium sp. SSM24]MCW3493784.1 DUF4350 domain-containing protein [Microbacterium sp. SSM24]